MDFRQLSTQIDTQPVGGELNASDGGGPIRSPSGEGGFSTVLHAVSQEIDGGRGAKPCAPQAETDDGPSTTTSNVSTTVSHETSSGKDAESGASLSEIGAASSTTTSSPEPLLLSLVGATMVTPAPTVASTHKAAGTDTSTNRVDGLSGISGTPTIQPIAQPAEGIASPVHSETGLSDLAGHTTTLATGDSLASLSSPMSESQPPSAGTATVIPVVEKPDISQPLSARQAQEAQSGDPHQGLPIVEDPEKAVLQTLVPSGQAVANGQDSSQSATTVTTQSPRQSGEGVAAPPDRSLAQQILGKAEPSLHQKNMLAESSETQTAVALSGHTPTEGQSFNAESDGQRKEDGLKWFSHVDLQSAEVLSRQSQQSVALPLDSGGQYPPYQQGQGGIPSNIQSGQAPTVSPSSQTNPLSPGPETPHVPVTHAVQFDLAPADFGQLRVRVVLSDQTIHTHLSTDRPELGQILTGQQEQLSTQLSAAGLDLGRFQVQVDQGKTNHSGQEWQSQAHGGTSQQQRDPRQQDPSQEVPVPAQKRTGMLSLFA